MAMYAAPGPDQRCLCLRFTIFDYAAKQFVYIGVYEELKHLQEFDVQILAGLAKTSLDGLAFERSPFRLHILCLQSIITAYRVANKLDKVKLGEPRKPKPHKVPATKYVARPKPETREVETCTLIEEFATGEVLLGALPSMNYTTAPVAARPSLKKPK